jgi:hypothetical protein
MFRWIYLKALRARKRILKKEKNKNMPIITNENENISGDDLEEKEHRTLFGFSTKNVFASKSLNFIYIIVMIVATAFAFHALSLILTGWSMGLIFLAALSVVGLPYCIKIIMYGRETFEYKHAVLCLIISLLPTIFDFVGFYSETSVKSALQTTKFEVLEKVNYFDKEVRKSISKQLLLLENETNSIKTKIEQEHTTKLKELNNKINDAAKDLERQFNSKHKQLSDKVNDAEQAFIDETEGVRGKVTSGVAGMGPRAKELEADIRKAKAEVDLEKKELENNKEKEIEAYKANILLEERELESIKNKELEKIQKEYETKKASLQQGVLAIDGLVSVKDGEEGLIFSVNKAKTFEELADTSIKLNSAINVVSAKLNTEPQFIKFKIDNVINLSFSALLRGDITALICFLLAILLEIVDTIIVYMVRGVKTQKKASRSKISNIRESIKYNF